MTVALPEVPVAKRVKCLVHIGQSTVSNMHLKTAHSTKYDPV